MITGMGSEEGIFAKKSRWKILVSKVSHTFIPFHFKINLFSYSWMASYRDEVSCLWSGIANYPIFVLSPTNVQFAVCARPKIHTLGSPMKIPVTNGC